MRIAILVFSALVIAYGFILMGIATREGNLFPTAFGFILTGVTLLLSAIKQLRG